MNKSKTAKAKPLNPFECTHSLVAERSTLSFGYKVQMCSKKILAEALRKYFPNLRKTKSTIDESANLVGFRPSEGYFSSDGRNFVWITETHGDGWKSIEVSLQIEPENYDKQKASKLSQFVFDSIWKSIDLTKSTIPPSQENRVRLTRKQLHRFHLPNFDPFHADADFSKILSVFPKKPEAIQFKGLYGADLKFPYLNEQFHTMIHLKGPEQYRMPTRLDGGFIDVEISADEFDQFKKVSNKLYAYLDDVLDEIMTARLKKELNVSHRT